MSKLLVISDPHITDTGETIIGLDTCARFKDSLAAALAAHGDAAALVLLGDLAHHGTVAAYTRLREALGDLPLPLIPLLGNHDRRDAFLQVFPDAPQAAGGFIQTSANYGPYRLITLDTLDGPPYPTGQHSGHLCPDRLNWLKAALDDASDQPVILALHHPPFDTGIAGMDAIKLRDAGPLLALLRGHGNVTLLCGHLHRTVSGVTHGILWCIFKSTAHQGPLDLTTPDSSLSVDEPPGYGVVLLQETGVVIHNQDVLAALPVQSDPASARHLP